MDGLKLFEDLLENVSKITYSNRNEFDLLEERAKMYVRKFFGDDSHYLRDITSIRYSPIIIIAGMEVDYTSSFEGGLNRFKKIITIIIEDIKLSTNYPASSSTIRCSRLTDLCTSKARPLQRCAIIS